MAVWTERLPILHHNTYGSRCDTSSFFVGMFADTEAKFCGSVFVDLWLKNLKTIDVENSMRHEYPILGDQHPQDFTNPAVTNQFNDIMAFVVLMR